MGRNKHSLPFLSAATLLPAFCFSCASASFVKETAFGYGTMWTVSVYNQDQKAAEAIATKVGETSRLCDNLETGSIDGVKGINEGKTVKASPFLLGALKSALSMQERTQGYFNPFMGELSSAWLSALKQGKTLSQEEIAPMLEKAKGTTLKIEGDMVSKVGEGTLDLGGIGKGMMCDLAKEILLDNKVTTYLVDGGKSSLLLGTSDSKGSPFSVSLPASSLKFEAKDCAISTSSIDQQTYLVDGVKYSHIVNPVDGSAKCLYDSITVTGEKAGELDALTTAMMGMDLDKIKGFCGQFGCKIAVLKDGKALYETLSLH